MKLLGRRGDPIKIHWFKQSIKIFSSPLIEVVEKLGTHVSLQDVESLNYKKMEKKELSKGKTILT